MKRLDDCHVFLPDLNAEFVETAKEIEKERDELAAQVSDLKCAAVEMAHEEDDGVVMRYFTQELMDECSGESLTRRDAQMKAEALEEALDLMNAEEERDGGCGSLVFAIEEVNELLAHYQQEQED